jgi:serine/threonine-protein kinase
MTKEGFEPLKKTVTLSDSDPSASWEGVFSRGSVTVDVEMNPKVPGAVVLLDGQTMTGTTIPGVTSGDQHKVVVGAPGYVDQAFTFIATPQETKRFDVTLVKEVHHAHHGTATPPDNGTPTPTPAGNGKLNVAAGPGWCNLSVDGVARGATPVAGLELPAGSHRLVCTPPDQPPQTATVTVTPDGVAKYKFALSQ